MSIRGRGLAAPSNCPSCFWTVLLLLHMISAEPMGGADSFQTPTEAQICVVIRTYWGHGRRADSGLLSLIQSLQRQTVTSWEAIVVVMDSSPFEELSEILQDIGDTRIWIFAEWIGPIFSPKTAGMWNMGYHALLYNLTDEAIRACPSSTRWVLATNGDNEYADTFFEELTNSYGADVVAFDFYSRYQRSTATPCDRFAHASNMPSCKTNKLQWCHTDLGANAFNFSRLIKEDRRFGTLAQHSNGLTADHYDGVMAQSMLNTGWKVKHINDQCLFDHSPSPQRCARLGGIWDDSRSHDPAGGAGSCISRIAADALLSMPDGHHDLEEVTVMLSSDGHLERFGPTGVAPLTIQCLRQQDAQHQTVQMMLMFGPLCAADQDVAAFAGLSDIPGSQFSTQSAGLQQQVFAHQLHMPHHSRIPSQPSRHSSHNASYRKKLSDRWARPRASRVRSEEL